VLKIETVPLMNAYMFYRRVFVDGIGGHFNFEPVICMIAQLVINYQRQLAGPVNGGGIYWTGKQWGGGTAKNMFTFHYDRDVPVA
jgi:hypothetical protein